MPNVREVDLTVTGPQDSIQSFVSSGHQLLTDRARDKEDPIVSINKVVYNFHFVEYWMVESMIFDLSHEYPEITFDYWITEASTLTYWNAVIKDRHYIRSTRPRPIQFEAASV